MMTMCTQLVAPNVWTKTQCTLTAPYKTNQKVQKTQLIFSPEKREIFKSLEGWVSQNVLPLASSVEENWQPHHLLPNSTLPTDEFIDQVKDLRERTAELSDEYMLVLVGDMIVEEGLPTYQSWLNRHDGIKDETGSSDNPWSKWIRSWTSEENRHGDLLKTYLYLTGRVDMKMIEKTIQYLIRAGMDIGSYNDPYKGFVYTSFQERVTSIADGCMSRLAKEKGDLVLARICGTIAADEKRHENAYEKIVEKLLEVDPSQTMIAIAEMLSNNITMPAHLMDDGQDPNLYNNFSLVGQRIGVYTVSDYIGCLEFLITKWNLEKVEGLTNEGQRAQEIVCRIPSNIKRIQERADKRVKKIKPIKFSWIFNKEI